MQDEYWMDRFGEKHIISEMETDYIISCLPFCVSGMTQVIAGYSFWLSLDPNDPMGPSDTNRMWMESNVNRLMEAPLLRALQEELIKRGVGT